MMKKIKIWNKVTTIYDRLTNRSCLCITANVNATWHASSPYTGFNKKVYIRPDLLSLLKSSFVLFPLILFIYFLFLLFCWAFVS